MTKPLAIQGSKKGAGGSPPVESANTLRSKTYVRVQDLLGYGEWEGLVGQGKGILLDDTPLFDASGDANFNGFQWSVAPGTQNQNFQSGFDTVENLVSVNTKLTKTNMTATRTITNSDADRLIVNFRVSYLYSQWPDGDLKNASLPFNITVSLNGGPDVEYAQFRLSDKCTSDYLGGTEIVLPKATENDTWTVKLNLLPDTGNDGARKKGAKIRSQLYWDSYSEVVTRKLRYPNCFIVGLEIDSQNFDSVPVRSYHVKMLKVKVPANYDPVARTYATTGTGTTNGGWNGTFKTAWTNNPAWVFYDLVTNKNVGIGQYAGESTLDKWSLYEISKYCDRLVPNGKGGQEPLFTANMYLQTREEALKVLNDLASCFRSIVYYQGGKILAIQDRPKSAYHLFTPSNVVGGKFTYTSTSQKSRKTVAFVRYNDPDNYYRPAIEVVEDYESILRYGYQEVDVTAFACTSRSQAHRFGRFILETEKRESDAVSWRTGSEALTLRLGDIVNVQDPNRATVRLGGRISGTGTLSTTVIPLDSQVTIEAGKTYSLSVYIPKATTEPEAQNNSNQSETIRPAQFETRSVTNSAGATSSLTVSAAFSAVPQLGAVWVLTASDLAPQQVRILSIKELENDTYELAGNIYSPLKFDVTEIDPLFVPTPVTRFPTNNIVLSPINLTYKIRTIAAPEGVSRFIDLSWKNADAYATKFRVTYTKASQLYTMADTQQLSVSIPVTTAGVYSISVYAVQPLNGSTSKPTLLDIQVSEGNPVPQYRVTGLELTNAIKPNVFANQSAKFVWRLNSPSVASEIGIEPQGAVEQGLPDPFFSHYAVRVYDTSTKTFVFSDRTTQTSYDFTYDKNREANGGIPLRAFVFHVSAVDKYNRESPAASISVSNPQIGQVSYVATPRQGGATIRISQPLDGDLDGYVCYASTSYPPAINQSNKVYEGKSNVFDINIQNTTSRIFFTLAAYDAFSKTELKFTPVDSFRPIARKTNIPTIASSYPTPAVRGKQQAVKFTATEDAATIEYEIKYPVSYKQIFGKSVTVAKTSTVYSSIQLHVLGEMKHTHYLVPPMRYSDVKLCVSAVPKGTFIFEYSRDASIWLSLTDVSYFASSNIKGMSGFYQIEVPDDNITDELVGTGRMYLRVRYTAGASPEAIKVFYVLSVLSTGVLPCLEDVQPTNTAPRGRWLYPDATLSVWSSKENLNKSDQVTYNNTSILNPVINRVDVNGFAAHIAQDGYFSWAAENQSAEITVAGFTKSRVNDGDATSSGPNSALAYTQEPRFYKKLTFSGSLLNEQFTDDLGYCLSKYNEVFSGYSQVNPNYTPSNGQPYFSVTATRETTSYGYGFSDAGRCDEVTNTGTEQLGYWDYRYLAACSGRDGQRKTTVSADGTTVTNTGCPGWQDIYSQYWNATFKSRYLGTFTLQLSEPIDYASLIAASPSKTVGTEARAVNPSSYEVINEFSNYIIKDTYETAKLLLSHEGGTPLATYNLTLYFNNFDNANSGAFYLQTSMSITFTTDESGDWSDEIQIPMPNPGFTRTFDGNYNLVRTA
jgi:predicted phage tail protein